jgi:hypothetical protein
MGLLQRDVRWQPRTAHGLEMLTTSIFLGMPLVMKFAPSWMMRRERFWRQPSRMWWYLAMIDCISAV